MRATKKVAISIVAFIVVTTAILSGCKTLLFSGGLGNAIKNLKPAPEVNGPTINRKRLKATQEVEAALAFVDARAGFTSYATSRDDRCYKGENDWKVSDGYAHRCTVRMTRFYGFSDDFRTHMLAFEDLLASDGWQLPQNKFPELPPATFREMFTTYYDVYCSGRPRIAVFGVGPIPRPACEASKLRRSGSDGYRKGDLVLWIEVAERGESNLYMMNITQRIPDGLAKEHNPQLNLYHDTNVQNADRQVQEITASHRYVVSVVVEEMYFEN